ncbi:hypothetical protein B0G80_2441 [Paraburkholderia sp. BL6669N2]|uniref:hypothetical protein n=1 Tax=Paraburkholderia sp. BL6669N2 TaxID=1938807 RepID=UPI000E28583B|nr:hypothetical protein [Paraburkholderia sp. BL6669N2]REG59670.1 hypothetical protein B0G80_2441 [Paraburkholderia sp. BL6669N2]
MSLYLHQSSSEGDETVRLESWSIRRFDGGARHFVGFSLETHDGRVSTEITELNVEARTARTASGRKYELVSGSGYNGDAEYVFNRVKEIIGKGQSWKDVTEELIPGSRRPRQRIEWPEDGQ